MKETFYSGLLQCRDSGKVFLDVIHDIVFDLAIARDAQGKLDACDQVVKITRVAEAFVRQCEDYPCV